jgi:glycerol-3-phosphate dehydrogenase (NAD+)
MPMDEIVAVLGSGSVGTVVADLISVNIRRLPRYVHKVKWWVFHEIINGEKLSDIVNNKHENVKYLPGKQLSNIIEAVTDLEVACRGCTILVLCIPPKYLQRLLPTIYPCLSTRCKVINICKDLIYNGNGEKFSVYSTLLKSNLQREVCVLHGCYDTNSLINGEEVEGTIGCTNIETGKIFKELFENNFFSINVVEDMPVVELTSVLASLCGLCGGFVDALDVSAITKANSM